MVLFNTVAVGLPGFAYLLIGYLPDEHPMWTVWLFTAILMFFSTAGGGFYKCGTLCSRQAIPRDYWQLLGGRLTTPTFCRQYSHFVVANIQFVKCLTLFVGPALMWLFVQDEGAQEQWRSIFLVLAAMLFLVGIGNFYQKSIIGWD